MSDLDAAALTTAHLAIENRLIQLRDAQIGVLGPANGFVVSERDGQPSPVLRMGTRQGLSLGIATYLEALLLPVCPHGLRPTLSVPCPACMGVAA